MKTDLDKIGYTYLFLDYVGYRDEQLWIMLDQATEAENAEDVVLAGITIRDSHAVTVEEGSPKYSVRFKKVHFYAVYEELANNWENDEIETTGVITKFKNSSLLKYVKEETVLFALKTTEIDHYCVKTANDFIHVLSVGEPEIVRENNS